MTSLLDVLSVGYWAARERVDVNARELDEAARIRAAATVAVETLWPLLRPEQREQLEDGREVVIATLVARVAAGEAVPDPAHVS